MRNIPGPLKQLSATQEECGRQEAEGVCDGCFCFTLNTLSMHVCKRAVTNHPQQNLQEDVAALSLSAPVDLLCEVIQT